MGCWGAGGRRQTAQEATWAQPFRPFLGGVKGMEGAQEIVPRGTEAHRLQTLSCPLPSLGLCVPICTVGVDKEHSESPLILRAVEGAGREQAKPLGTLGFTIAIWGGGLPNSPERGEVLALLSPGLGSLSQSLLLPAPQLTWPVTVPRGGRGR